MTMLPKNRPPTHLGEMLLEEFLKPLGLSQVELANRIHVSYPRVNELINGKRGVSPDTALRLAKLLGTTPEFWLNGQLNWDLWHAIHAPESSALRNITPVKRPSAQRQRSRASSALGGANNITDSLTPPPSRCAAPPSSFTHARAHPRMDAALEPLRARFPNLDHIARAGAYEIVRAQGQAFQCRDRIAG